MVIHGLAMAEEAVALAARAPVRRAVGLAPGDVAAYWRAMLPHIEAALEEGDGGHSASDILLALLNSRMQAWLGWCEGGIEFILVTELVERPRHKACRIVLAAGSHASSWIDGHLHDIEAWARKEGCAALELQGRKGWSRKLSGAWSRTLLMRKAL